MSHVPEVDVLLVNWNGGVFLDDAIESVVRQSYSNWRLFAVDNGSSDSSRTIMQEWTRRDDRIVPTFLGERLRFSKALNRGLSQSSAPLVARIDSDDVWLADRLECQVGYLQSGKADDVGVCGADVGIIDATGCIWRYKHFPRSHEACMAAMWYRNPFCHSAVLIRREVLEASGGYNEGLSEAEDLDLWFRAASLSRPNGKHWELRNLPKTLVYYRIWAGAVTARRLWRCALGSLRVRRSGSRLLGRHMPVGAELFGLAALAVAVLPSGLVRRLFELTVARLPDREDRRDANRIRRGSQQRTVS